MSFVFWFLFVWFVWFIWCLLSSFRFSFLMRSIWLWFFLFCWSLLLRAGIVFFFFFQMKDESARGRGESREWRLNWPYTKASSLIRQFSDTQCIRHENDSFMKAIHLHDDDNKQINLFQITQDQVSKLITWDKQHFKWLFM